VGVDEQLGLRAAGESFALGDRLLDCLGRVAVILRRRDVPAGFELRPVVGDTADSRDAALTGLVLAEVELPDLVRAVGWHHVRGQHLVDLAIDGSARGGRRSAAGLLSGDFQKRVRPTARQLGRWSSEPEPRLVPQDYGEFFDHPHQQVLVLGSATDIDERVQMGLQPLRRHRPPAAVREILRWNKWRV
jgi:hypothetical protein